MHVAPRSRKSEDLGTPLGPPEETQPCWAVLDSRPPELEDH